MDALKKLPDESVDCIITSPPYYGLRSYNGAETNWGDWQGQLGLEPTYQMYLDHLLMVTAELKRILKKTGTLFWNMGDSYAGKMGKRQGWNDNLLAYTREEALKNGTSFYLNADYGNIPNKSLMLIPERFAIRMIEQGWILRNKILWIKLNGLPSSVKDRFSNKWEYIFFFVKSRKYYFDLDAVRKPFADPEKMLQSVSGKKYFSKEAIDAFMGNPQKGINRPRPNLKNPENISKYLIERTPNGSLGGRVIRNIADGKYYTFVRKALTNVNEYLKEKLEKSNYSVEELAKLTREPVTKIAHYFRTDLSGAALPSKTFWNKIKDILNLDDYDKFIKEEIKSVIPAYEKGANPGDVLEIATRPHHFAHFAVFPTTLIAPLMKAGCPPQGVVLDPFAGSGTTGVVAEILGRDAILIEISQEYVKIIEERLQPENLKKESEVLKRYEAKNSPGRTRTAVTGSKGRYAWPLHHRASSDAREQQ